MDTQTREFVFHIDSKNATRINSTHSILYSLGSPLYALADEDMFLQVISFTIPYSFYNINSTNRFLSVMENGFDVFTINIPTGNYNILQIIDLVRTRLNQHSPNGLLYTMSYDRIQNRISMSVSHGSATLLFGSGQNVIFDMEELLGFSGGIDRTLPAVSNSTCNVQTYSNIFVLNSSFGISNQYSSVNGNMSRILAKIPVNTSSSYSYIYYTNDLLLTYKCSISSFTEIDLSLVDQDQDPIDLNGNNFFCSLRVIFKKKATPSSLPNLTEMVPIDFTPPIDEPLPIENNEE